MNGGILGMLAPQSHAASNGGLLGQLQQAWRPVWQDQGIGQGAGASPFNTQQLMGALGHAGSPVYGAYSGVVKDQNKGAGAGDAPPPAATPPPTAPDRPSWSDYWRGQMEAMLPGWGGNPRVNPSQGLMDMWRNQYAGTYFPEQAAYQSFMQSTSSPFGIVR